MIINRFALQSKFQKLLYLKTIYAMLKILDFTVSKISSKVLRQIQLVLFFNIICINSKNYYK